MLRRFFMVGKNTAVFGIYRDRTSVETAVDALRQQGFRSTDISVIGGTLGWLVGIGALAIPGLGPFIAAGPIMAALAGAGAGGVVGGLAGALVGMGIPEYEAKRYEGRVKEGGILLSVHSDNSEWTKKAKEILERTGAQDISSAGEAAADFQKTDKPMTRSAKI
jgi:hypothetical protein